MRNARGAVPVACESEPADGVFPLRILREVAPLCELREFERGFRRVGETRTRLIETVTLRSRGASLPAFAVERHAQRELARGNSLSEIERHRGVRIHGSGIGRVAIQRREKAR